MAQSNPNERMRFCTRCKTNVVWRFEKKGEFVDPMTGEVLEYRRMQRICSCDNPIMNVVEMPESTFRQITSATLDLQAVISSDDKATADALRSQWSGGCPPAESDDVPPPEPDEAPADTKRSRKAVTA